MALNEAQVRDYTSKLLHARMGIMLANPFFGSLLMGVKLSLDEECDTAYTDGVRICFGTEFLKELTLKETEFVMLHEIMHIVLRHCKRGTAYNSYLFNVACDIVVNSTILEAFNMDTSVITLSKYGESMHTVPDGSEGVLYSAEEVYAMLLENAKKLPPNASGMFSDDHSKWQEDDGTAEQDDMWAHRVMVAAETAQRMKSGKGECNLPRFAEEMLEARNKRHLDWRVLLRNFIEEDVCDYSFNPPDKRYDETGFYLPDYNESGEDCRVRKILFMIDTSGSVSTKEVTEAFLEIESALDQFSSVEGWLGFFDSGVKPPVPFENKDELMQIRPVGGGGTSFYNMFRYIREEMNDDPPVSIVVFTDGYDRFPDESAAAGIPVLWVICHTDVTPPWGTVARIGG